MIYNNKPEPDFEGEGGGDDEDETAFVSDWVGGAPNKRKKKGSIDVDYDKI